ncbi:MAG TPA: tetratricopeptide repeat protein [Roseiflexaceae bacterium]|nr:tetratricopeptide repeat protein [Roseiflexaceae bacterium]
MSKSKKPKSNATPRHVTQRRDIDRWLDRAARQLAAGDYPGVIATAGRVVRTPIASREQRAEAYDRLGGAYTLLQQHEDAYAMVSAAVELTPDDPLLWYNRGITARYTTRLGQSLRDFERAQALDADGVLAHELAEALPFARSLAEHELELRGPDFTLDELIAQETLFQQAVRVMAEGHWAEAEPLFRQSIAMGDVLPQPWGNLGVCLLMQRQFDAAEAALRRALEIDPGYTIARQNLAGLPKIRATGQLPAMRLNTSFDGKPVNVGLKMLIQDDK